jgi:hypothetical protein
MQKECLEVFEPRGVYGWRQLYIRYSIGQKVWGFFFFGISRKFKKVGVLQHGDKNFMKYLLQKMSKLPGLSRASAMSQRYLQGIKGIDWIFIGRCRPKIRTMKS